MKKILVAVDESEGALKTADSIGKLFSGATDLRITVLHVIPNLPAPLWDDGHILTEEEREARKQVIDKWLDNQKLKLAHMFDKVVEKLTSYGISPDAIETKTVSDTLDVAEKILFEAKDGGYHMLALGRHGYSKTKRLVMGSVATAVINHGAGLTVCVVE